MKNPRLAIVTGLALLCAGTVLVQTQSALADDADFYMKRGEFDQAAGSAFQKGDYNKSEDITIKALAFCEKRKLPSQSVYKLKNLLKTCDQTGHYSKCSDAYRRSIAVVDQLNSGVYELYSGLIDSLVEEGKFKDAISVADDYAKECSKSMFGKRFSAHAQAEKAVLLLRTGQKAQAEKLIKTCEIENFNRIRSRRFDRLSESVKKTPCPRKEILNQQILKETALFPNVKALFDMGEACANKKQDSKAIEYWRRSLDSPSYEVRSGHSNWSDENFYRRKAALGLVEIYEKQKMPDKAAAVCKQVIEKLTDIEGGRWSNIVFNEHLIKDLSAQNKSGDALSILHNALSEIASQAKIPSRSTPYNYPDRKPRPGANQDYLNKLYSASEVFDQALALSQKLRSQNKLAEAQKLMEHLIAVPGSEFPDVRGGSNWIEELARIYMAQKNYKGAQAQLQKILAPLVPLAQPKDDYEVREALAVISTANSYFSSRKDFATSWDETFLDFARRFDLLQECLKATNDTASAAKLYKQHAMMMESEVHDPSARKAQRLDYVAERLSSQCHDASAINYYRKAADAARKVLNNQDRIIVGLVKAKQSYDVLQILRDYQVALLQNKQAAEAAEIEKEIAKYELASKAGKMNGKQLPPSKWSPPEILCGNDSRIPKMEEERMQRGRETLRKLGEAADREHIR